MSACSSLYLPYPCATGCTLLARLNVNAAGTLNIFSSKEQENEQRAAMMKKLAFIICASETDQYAKSMPDIQERLTECLRLQGAPSVHAQVFLCFRVLLLRMSPQHLTSLWHIFVPELVSTSYYYCCFCCAVTDVLCFRRTC